jgi:hypothetical protein
MKKIILLIVLTVIFSTSVYAVDINITYPKEYEIIDVELIDQSKIKWDMLIKAKDDNEFIIIPIELNFKASPFGILGDRGPDKITFSKGDVYNPYISYSD